LAAPLFAFAFNGLLAASFSGLSHASSFAMVVLFLRFYGPKPVLVYPFGLPLSTWFSGHISALRDTEGHKKSSRLLSVCDFVRNIESVQIACEASALPLSQAGDKFFIINNLRGLLSQLLAANSANIGIVCDLGPLAQ
jgi:hypothetical protein